MNEIKLSLYISGDNILSRRSLSNVKDILSKCKDKNIKLEIVDILEDPDRAETDKILAIPTFARLEPKPVKKVFGLLDDHDRIIDEFELVC